MTGESAGSRRDDSSRGPVLFGPFCGCLAALVTLTGHPCSGVSEAPSLGITEPPTGSETGTNRAVNTDPDHRLARVDPGAWEHLAMRRALAARDLAQVFRLLRKVGVSQRAIAAATGLAPSEVYEILRGRRVMAYEVLCRIADGLGVPRGYLGLAYDTDTEALLGTTSPVPTETGEDGDVHALLAHAAEVTMGVNTDPDRWRRPGDEAPTPVPERLGASDVSKIEQVTAGLRALDYRYGGGACRDAVIAQTRWVNKLLHADATDALRRRLHITLADLHNLAGWTSLDVGLYRPARRHFAEAITQARQAGEPSLLANVLYRTGRLHLHRGLTVHALRFFQLGQIAARDAADPLAVAVLSANEAWAYGMLGDATQADGSLHRARQEYARAEAASAAPWVRFFGPADLDATTGMVHLGLAAADAPAAKLDTARESLTASLAARGPDMARSRAFELTALATACLYDHDPGEGIPLARQVTELVGELRSARVIDRLAPLIDQLAVTPGADAADLTRQLSAAGTR